MKRLILLATMVAVLASCEKTEIQNEVLTPIGFSSNVGKQTKAIVDGTNYNTSQPFGVYAYSHQTIDNEVTTNTMINVEISYNNTDQTWKATSGKYYWPNDSRTTLNFYAYSPYCGNDASAQANHQKLNGTISHTEDGGLSITGYTHKNMYVDYMTATPVKNAKYDDNTTNTGGKVGIVFAHQMTQIIFKVKTNESYDNINFKLQSITLNNIKNAGSITNGVFDNNTTGTASFTIYPAKAESDENGAPNLDANQTAGLVIDNTINEDSEIIPVTMIPQAFNQGQSFTIVYTIDGTGVANETVSKTIELPSSPAWAANKKITYNLSIGLKEITFSPSITDWSPESAQEIEIFQ